MFTGLVQDIGSIESVEGGADGARLRIATRLGADIGLGDSIAVNGVCLTATEADASGFATEAMNQTLEVTVIGALEPGARVNLELATRADERLGGHIVQGHVDARGQFAGVEDHGESWTLRIKYPSEIARYLVFKGSVAVEGISLTIAGLTDEYFEIAIIPKTWDVTNLSHLKPGDDVNLEVDVMGKYVEKLLAHISK